MQKVLEVKTSTESKGSIVNGKIQKIDVFAIWVLTLDCGHRVKRRNTSPNPPERVKCDVCARNKSKSFAKA